MVRWPLLLAVIGLTRCQLQSHLVPPLQDQGHHLGHSLGHQLLGHPGQTQAILHNTARQRHSLQVHGPNAGQATHSATVQVQSASQIIPSLVQSPQQALNHHQPNQQQLQQHQQALQSQQQNQQQALQQQNQQQVLQQHNQQQALQPQQQNQQQTQTLTGQSQPKASEQDVKNHALFYRSANGNPTNKYHRESRKVEIPGNKTVDEILQWLQTHYKAVNLRKGLMTSNEVVDSATASTTLTLTSPNLVDGFKSATKAIANAFLTLGKRQAREDLSRAYLPADLSSTQEPRPFQTQNYSPQPTTPAPNNYGVNNQRPTTPRQNVFPSTPGYQVQASQQKGIGYQPTNQQSYNKQQSVPQRAYQQPFQSQAPYSPTGQDKPTKTYIPPQPSYQPPTPQYQTSQSQQGYQPTQQSYQPSQQPGYQSSQPQQGSSYQPSQQGYQPSTQQGYQSTSQQGYGPSTSQQGYGPSTSQQGYGSSTSQQGYGSSTTQQGYQPSSTPRPSYQPQTSTGQPSYSSTALPSSGPTQHGGYSPTVQPSSPTGPSSTYNPSEQGYPAPSKPSPGLSDGPGYPEPVNTVQPPFFNEDGDNQLTNSYPNQGSSVSPPSGTQSSPTTAAGQGFRPGDAGNQQGIGQHPPHIHELNVQCSKESMIVNIEFNEPFNGVIYSKGHHNEPECRYVQPNSGDTKFSFTLNLNSCGTQYIEDFASGNPAYLENTLVIQNEPGILEIWDYIRNVKCLWEGSITQSLSTGLSIDGLNQEVVTFSGDTAKAKLELQAGRGPFSYENVNLVRIGDLMTLVITVEGDNGFNIRVGECIATDGQPNSLNRISLTDDRGCTIKSKVMGAFQFTRNPTSGASVAYAFFRAFKFPDVMELAIECSVQLCKTECAPCPDPNQLIEPRRRRSVGEDGASSRRRRWVQNATEEVYEELRLRNKIQVFLPEELPSSEMSFSSRNEQICITPYVFYSTSSLLLFLTSVSTLAWMYFWYKAMSTHRKH